MKSGEKALTIQNVEKLLEVITDLNHSALIKLAITGGIRRGDIIGIYKKNVNFENNSVMFFENKKQLFHTVFIPIDTMNTLAMSVKSNKKTPFLFPANDIKRHICSKTAYNILQKYLKKAGIERRPFHALRATCIKLAQKKGWTSEQTAKHIDDTVRVVQEHYATPSNEEMSETAKERPII